MWWETQNRLGVAFGPAGVAAAARLVRKHTLQEGIVKSTLRVERLAQRQKRAKSG